MTITYEQLWQNCLKIIKENVKESTYSTWFEPIKPSKFEDNVLTIAVPNKFFYEYIEEHYVDVLKKAIKSELGEGGRLEYQMLVDDHRKIGYNNAVDRNKPGSHNVGNIKNPFVIPGIQKMKIDPQLNDSYRFENFIEGDCNKLARSAGIAISRNPGGTAFNPLFVYGDVGLGKTHLVHAVGNQVLDNHPNCTVLYVTMERFTNQVVQSIRNNAINDFMNFYQCVDVLIIDDIHFLANRTKTQEIFFNIFNILHQNGKQIILTSDRPPKDLQDMEERLISRFKWGLSADLSSPEFETRLAILEEKMNSEGVELPEEVVEYVCFNIKNNIRELEGVMISLIAQSSLNDRDVDLDLAKEVICQFVSQINKEITVENIAKLVAEHFELSVEKLKSKTRKRSVVVARQLSMFFAKNFTNKSLKAIGNNFGGRDHSTVIHSVRAIQDMMDTDLLFKDTVSEIEKKLQLSLNVAV